MLGDNWLGTLPWGADRCWNGIHTLIGQGIATLANRNSVRCAHAQEFNAPSACSGFLLAAPRRHSRKRMPSPVDLSYLPPGDPETCLQGPEGARLRFRGFCYKEAAGPREALAQLRKLCRQWLRPESCSKEQILELLVLEQFLGTLPPEIQAWVRRQQPGCPEEAAALVEGLQQDPGQLLGWITAHILKPEVRPAVQETEESSGSPQPSMTVDLCGAGPGEGPPDTLMDGSAQLNCSVKEELSVDGQEMAPVSPLLLAPSSKHHLEHRESASTSLEPVRTQEQWALLDPSQKELYWDAMLQKYGSAVSLGLPDRELSACPTHQDPPVPRKPYMCAQCGCGFNWKSVFVMHRRSHTRAPEPLPQPCASRSTPRHTPGHTCQDCGRSFSWKSQLVIHRKAHAGQRRHTCGDCGRAFDWKSQLVIHCQGHRPKAP